MSEWSVSQKEILESFISGADQLEEVVTGLTEEQLDYSVAPGEWSIRQIIHHVATDGDAWSIAFQKAIANPGAPIRFEGFLDNEVWADALAFRERPIENALALLNAHRRVIAGIAEKFPDKWEGHAVILSSEGDELHRITAGEIIGMLTGHLEEHIGTVKAIREKHGIS